MRAGLGIGLSTIMLSALLAACGGSSGGGGSGGFAPVAAVAGTETAAQSTPPAPAANANAAPVLIESRVQTPELAAIDVSPFKDRPAGARPVPRHVLLPSLPTESALPLKSAPAVFGTPTKIGVARRIAETANVQSVSSMMSWTPSERGGKLAALRFASPDAKGVRIGLRVESLPLGTMVSFYGDTSKKLYEVSAQEILATIQRNLDAGDSSDNARIYWSPNMGGEALTVEIEVPPNAVLDAVKVAVPMLSHVAVDITKQDSLQKIGEAGTCNLDVTCASQYDTLSKSVALMDFIQDGGNYVCTGTLLNDRMSTGTPYFLSANHCISNQTVASTLYTLWSYKSASCNSTQVSPALVTIGSGATLLYAESTTDTSFMRLNSQPPAGALFAGSSPFEPRSFDGMQGVYGVHHPKGDLQKYSEGDYLGTAACGSSSCNSSTGSDAKFLAVRWNRGVTEGGSSGSGLFRRLNGKDYLVGQLLGGASSCSQPAGYDFYGRFDLPFNAALQQWLNAPSTTVRTTIYRFYNTKTGAHFYTSNVPERDLVITKLHEYSYEGPAFFAFGAAAPGTSPVYRFYNTRTGAHFYTIDEQERARVQGNWPWYLFEGVAWYANTSQSSSATPMFRFYQTKVQTHFYTINASERDSIQQNLPMYTYEGIAYFGWTSL
ncbi:serine protease [Variovorax sp. VRV01]|uniref:serine protease n=1 Tax=Variovorax sp. VRV01 TaxID=2769259 RepID=UPI00177E5FF2|nr:serine protease [Variovorax sp. VRV01]MBD9662395.1 serine protease [Variovorax sp. VRV01]